MNKYAYGVMLNIVGGMFMMGIGLIFTLTLIGAIIGIPLMILGFLMVIVSPFGGALIDREKCPYCQNTITFLRGQKGATCKNCKKRLILRGSGKEQVFEVVT